MPKPANSRSSAINSRWARDNTVRTRGNPAAEGGNLFGMISKLMTRLSLLRTDVWAGAEFERDGRMCVLRFRPEYPLKITQFDYRFLVHIKYAYVPGQQKGMPSQGDLDRMFSFEKKLNGLEFGRVAFLMAAWFGNGSMEWLWYSRDHGEALEIIDKRIREIDGSPIETSTTEEGDWRTYYDIVPDNWLKDYRTQTGT